MLRLNVILVLACAFNASCKLRLSDSNLSEGKEVSEFTIETNNNASLRAKIDVIKNAQSTLDIAYYIFKDDVVGKTVALKIQEAADRNVKVRIIVDGSLHFLNRDFFKAMIAMNPQNISVAYFRPISFSSIAKEFEGSILQLANLVGKLFVGNGEGASNLSYHELLRSSPAQLKTLWDLSVGAFLNPMKEIPPLSDMRAHNDMTFAQNLARALASSSNRKLAMDELARLADYLASRSKRMHHKLILADNTVLVTGGRNMWAPSHFDEDQPRADSAGRVFVSNVDTDIIARSSSIGQAAKANFESYWDCIDNPGCAAGIDMEKESASNNGRWYWAKHVQGSEAYLEAALKGNRWSLPLGTYTYKGSAANASFIENSMHKDPNKKGFLSEVPNRILLEFVDRLNAAKAGEKILLKSAYMILPPEIFEPLVSAINRGADVIIMTNGLSSADHPIVPFFGRQQYPPFIVASQLGKGSLKIYDYHNPQLIHDKVLIVGDYIYVGSSNSDPRSFFLNTEIGIMIGPDSESGGNSFAKSYYEWQLQQIETLSRKTFANKNGIKIPMIEKMELSQLLKEEFEPSYYSFLERPKYEVFMSLREAFKKSIMDNPDKAAYQDYLYRYLLLQL